MRQLALFILLFLAVPAKLYANMHFDAALARPHVVVMMHSTYGNGSDKAGILGAILESMAKQYFNDTPYIFVQFGDDLLYRHHGNDLSPMQYALGYDTIAADLRYWFFGKRNKDFNPKVLSLYCSDVQFDMVACLKLVWFGLRYKNLIAARQRTVTSLRYTSVAYMPAIPRDYIYDIIHYPFPQVDTLIKRKWFRHLCAWEPARHLEYYYQNNRYHFYYVRNAYNAGAGYSYNAKAQQEDTAGKALLEIDDLYAITDGGTQFLVLNSDSTAYYLYPSRGIVKGPADIPYSRLAHVYDSHVFNQLMMCGAMTFCNRYDTGLYSFVPDFANADSITLQIFANDTLLQHRAQQDVSINKRITLSGWILWLNIICAVIVAGRRYRSRQKIRQEDY
jgi:hypothetical protein